MRQSIIFTKTSEAYPKDEVATNARLLIKAGYIDKLMAGVYSYLFLGWRVLKKIENIIREEMDAIGGQEIYLPALQPKYLWDQTGRWDTLKDIMYQFDDGSNHSIGLATTHEEVITTIAKRHIKSYKDLPRYVYQIQNKYRNEPRAKSGLIRGREFLMKDLYSFHTTEADLDEYYERVKIAYKKIFDRCGLKTLVIEASGGVFSKSHSHEFTVLSEAGEDRVIHCVKCDFAQNGEINSAIENSPCPNCRAALKVDKGIEVGNIFKLKTKFSDDIKLLFTDELGHQKSIVMASYGIGLGRLMGTIVEIYNDADGLVWPDSVAPFRAHLITLGNDENCIEKANNFYETCQKKGIEILYDDRNISPGQKLKDADLLGIPYRLVISQKTALKIEVKKRIEKKSQLIDESELIKLLVS